MTTDDRFFVRRAAVLGAGVMGAQIAAHLVNAGVEPVLFDLPAGTGDPDGIVLRGLQALRTLEPSPLGTPAAADRIAVANYDRDLERLEACDLVIEAIAERLEPVRGREVAVPGVPGQLRAHGVDHMA